MKSNYLIILALFVATLSPTLAGPKIATFSIDKVLKEYYLHLEGVTAYQTAKEKLSENPRRKTLAKMQEDMRSIAEKMQGLSPKSEEYLELQKNGRKLQASSEELLREWNKFQSSEIQKLIEDFISKSTQRNQEITDTITQIAETEGFDWVFETSGTTSSKTPVVLYVRDSTELTDRVIEILNKDAPENDESPSADE